MKAKAEIFALVLGFLGLFGTVLITALPMWRVSAFIGANLIVMEELWEGLWMNCYRQADIRMQCKVYDSLLILPPELQAARGLMCVSILLVVVALSVSGCGTQRSKSCADNMRCKNVTLAVGGSLFLLSFLTTLIPVCWVAHTVIRNFHNPALHDGQKRELGESLFIGWGTAGLLLLTGIILLLCYSKRRSKEGEDEPDYHALATRGLQKVGSERSSSQGVQVYV
ncbi:claudin-17-like [Synchiropus splendidus]|uniref:claudin-17-like n=1 Tax=Synchiropus splendidus TaxID=270530 RepID=UPI00237E858A|nr:claudin-17-like [Synchiropus splendidus]